MRPLASLPADEARRLRGLLFDLDDTALSHGVLTRDAYDAMWDLHDAGLSLVAVTGRPSGWGEVLARQWPIAGAVTENGAVHLVRDGHGGVARKDSCGPEERKERRAKLDAIVADVRVRVPEAALTDDAPMRLSDVTWDVGERVKLPPDRVAAVCAVIDAHGARRTQSSVHLHASFDTDDKASGALRFLSRELGVDAGAALATFAFVGDSGNDAACFNAFRTTFGVANVAASLARLTMPPRYVASREMGDGFAEIARGILARRSAG